LTATELEPHELVKRRGIFMFRHRASTRAYVDIPPLRYCSNCWLLDHPTRACQRKPRCRLCAGEHTETNHECNLCGSIGSTCEHTVTKCVHCLDSNS
ncbi:hypothetical protein K439DRAFT_1291299, partial [Ramaria rubella]